MPSKVSALTSGGTPQGTDEIHANRAGVDRKLAVSGLLALANATGSLAVANGGTGSTTAAGARTALGVDAAGTDNSTDVTLSGAGTYISIAGQVITVDAITESDISDLGTYLTAITGEPLSDLSDVTITTIASGEVLKWNGTAWVNNTLAEAGIAAASHNHTASEVTDLASATVTFTNKTIDANGTGNSITNIETADLATAAKTGSDTKVVTGTAGTTDYLGKWNADGDLVDSSIGEDGTGLVETIAIACSDETTALTASTSVAKATFTMPYAMTVTEVMASVVTAPTGATLIVDIHDGATTIMSTNKLDILASATVDDNTATLSDTALAKDAIISIYADQVGATVAGAGLKVYITGTRT